MPPMTLRSIIIAVFAFLAGVLSYALLDSTQETGHNTENDWKAVEAYRAFILNPSNYKVDSKTGFMMATPPPDPAVNLAALVAAGELEHADLVFPNVASSGPANRHWKRWARQNIDILHAEGNPGFEFEPSGQPRLHLNLWFRKSATAAVQKLVQELEQFPAEGR